MVPSSSMGAATAPGDRLCNRVASCLRVRRAARARGGGAVRINEQQAVGNGEKACVWRTDLSLPSKMASCTA